MIEEAKYWQHQPNTPERKQARELLEKLHPLSEPRKVRRAKIDGVNVVIGGDVVYPFRSKLEEHLAYSCARFSIPPIPSHVSIVRDAGKTFLTDGRLRLPIDLSSPKIIRLVASQFTEKQDNE